MAITDAVITHDISADDDRARVAALLSRKGVRLQHSVFKVRVPAEEFDELVEQISSLVNVDRDVVHLFRQCNNCMDIQQEIGQAPPDLNDEFWIV